MQQECVRSQTSGLKPIYELASIIERVRLEELFAERLPLDVELGSGDGSFLIEYAGKHPEWNFIGVERLLGRLRKIGKKAVRAGLSNVRGVRIESAYFLEYLLPQHSAAAVHIYFPDPWPKRKHRRHRLNKERFPTIAAQALTPGGRVYLRTDDEDYFEQMQAVFQASTGFRGVETPEELANVLTDFEREFNARGVRTLRAAYELL